MITFIKSCNGLYFEKTWDDSGHFSACDATWIELLSEFQDFLAGCGYIIPDKTQFDIAEIVDDAWSTMKTEKYGSKK